MKFIITILLLFVQLQLSAQNHGQHQPPPVNNPTFGRSLHVDCTDKIINDLKNGNVNSFNRLKAYIKDNFISYIALGELDHGSVVGNAAMEAVLVRFVKSLRMDFPSLKIGVIAKNYNTSSLTPSLSSRKYFSTNCMQPFYTAAETDQLVNRFQTIPEMNRSETMKFFLRAINLVGSTSRPRQSFFDAVILDDPYWTYAGSLSLTDIKNRFEIHKSILRLLQQLKCSVTGFTVESNFLPTDHYRLSGWTATDQIEQADPLCDYFIIPFYTDPINAVNAFDSNCKLLHLLSDRFSKDGTQFYAGFSAESGSFNYCNSSMVPGDYLGDYLHGTATVNGNLFSAEKYFLDKYNSQNYICSTCSCYPYQDNQYTPANLRGNKIAGSMWKYYSMMENNSLFRIEAENTGASFEVDIALTSQKITITSNESEKFIYSLSDLSGKRIAGSEIYKSFQETELQVSEGIYILNIINTKGETLSRRIPVLNK